jgi:hypothetical protein
MRRFLVLFLGVLCLASVASAPARSGTPEKQIAALVDQLKTDKRDTAMQDFFGGSLMAAQKDAAVKAMDAQAKGAWEFYGPPTGYEISEKVEMGKSLVKIKWITRHKDDTPLFWNALFYKRNGAWEPLRVLFFDDPTKAGF